jgi:hypothetical protein
LGPCLSLGHLHVHVELARLVLLVLTHDELVGDCKGRHAQGVSYDPQKDRRRQRCLQLTKSDDLAYLGIRKTQSESELERHKEAEGTDGVGCDPEEVRSGSLVESHEALRLGSLPDAVDRVLVQQASHAAVGQSLGGL